MGAKKVIYQFAYGDQTVPNPTSATLMRAGGLQDVTTFYRNDRTPTAGSNPHGFLLDPTLTGRNLGQAQVLDFLASGGETIVRPGRPRRRSFEVPIADPASLETLNFTQDPAAGEPPPEAASGATGSCTGAVDGRGRRMRGARRLQGREGAPARAPRALRVLTRACRGRATVEVFQASVGRRVVGNRRIARFTGRRRSFTWSGRRARNGLLFARFRVRVARGVTDVRRVTLRRSHGRFRARTVVLPSPQLRPADRVQARLARSSAARATARRGSRSGSPRRRA